TTRSSPDGFAAASVPQTPADAAVPEWPSSVAVSVPSCDVMSCLSCGVVSSQLTDAPHLVGGAEVLRELLLGLVVVDDERAPADRDGLDVRAFGTLVIAVGEGNDVLTGRLELDSLHIITPDGLRHLGRIGRGRVFVLQIGRHR